MKATSARKPGRPRSPSPLSAAERMRRYRARLRARGVRAVREVDPLVAALSVAPETLLTPGEQDVIRRFCRGMRALERLPEEVAVFGSRARGDANERSDLDLAVTFDGERDAALESAISGIALEARKPYRSRTYGIFLRAVPFYLVEGGLPVAIRREREVLWTRPR